jgi:predicted permease
MILGTYGSSGNEETGLTRIQSEVGRLLSPPVVGCFTGIFVGATPALRTIFFQGLGTPLFSAMKTLGTAYIPAALLVLAGSLVKPKSDEVEESSVSKKAILSILFSRFVLSPLSALLLVHFMGKFNMLSSARNKAIVTFVLLMEGCMVSRKS